MYIEGIAMWHTDNTIHEAHKNEIVRIASIPGAHDRHVAALRTALAFSSTSDLTADRFRGFIGVLTMAALDPTTVSEARNANAVQSES